MQTHLECVDLVFLLVFLSYWASVPTRTNFPFRQDFSPLSSPFLKASRCDLSFCSICHLGQIHINGRQKEKLFVFIIGLGATFCNPKKIYWTSMNILLKEKETHWLFQWFIKCSSNYLASVHKESNPNNHISSTFYVPTKIPGTCRFRNSSLHFARLAAWTFPHLHRAGGRPLHPPAYYGDMLDVSKKINHFQLSHLKKPMRFKNHPTHRKSWTWIDMETLFFL